MMSNYEDEGIVVDAVQAGASGYLVKDCSRDLLLHTVLAVASGGILVKASLLQRAFGIAERGSSPPARERPKVPALPVEALTSREESILRLMAEGKTNRAIAETLGFAEVTIKKHVQDIIAKLYASDRTHAAIIAVRLGFID
jgi:DNA-binding NarL/FixJ family response regulator